MNQIARPSNRMSEMHDDQLLAAVAQGDPGALRELFDRHSPWLAARLRSSLPVEAVEEVLQETFLAGWRGAGRFTAIALKRSRPAIASSSATAASPCSWAAGSP